MTRMAPSNPAGTASTSKRQYTKRPTDDFFLLIARANVTGPVTLQLQTPNEAHSLRRELNAMRQWLRNNAGLAAEQTKMADAVEFSIDAKATPPTLTVRPASPALSNALDGINFSDEERRLASRMQSGPVHPPIIVDPKLIEQPPIRTKADATAAMQALVEEANNTAVSSVSSVSDEAFSVDGSAELGEAPGNVQQQSTDLLSSLGYGTEQTNGEKE